MQHAKHAVPVAAVSAVAAVPAVFAAAVPAAPAVHGQEGAVLDARAVHQLPAARPLVTKVTSASSGKSYTVVSGDTLSGIAGRSCGDAGGWPSIWHQNQAEVPNPDLIYPGQTLRFACDGSELRAPERAARLPSHAAPSPAAPSHAVSSHAAPSRSGASAAVTGVSGGVLSCAGLEALWEQAGGPAGEAFIAAEIAMAESGGNPNAVSPTDDFGLWQINGTHGAQATLDPLRNAQAAVAISGGGTDWSPWTTYVSGAYRGRC